MSGRANTSASFKENNTSWFRIGWVQAMGVLILLCSTGIRIHVPAAFRGRVLYQVDGAAAVGTGRMLKHWRHPRTHFSLDGKPIWRNAADVSDITRLSLVEPLKDVGALMRLEYRFDLMPGDTYLLLMMLLGGYVFMRSWGTRRLLSRGYTMDTLYFALPLSS